MKTTAASLTVVLLAFIALAAFTHGFQTWTREQARRLDIAQHRPQVPDITVIDETGAEHRLGDWIKSSHKAALIQFIYTRCSAVCRTLGSENQKLQARIREQGLQDRSMLLSISFDPKHDNASVLSAYANRQNADSAIWRFSTVSRQEQLGDLLAFFGITVIPDEFGGFQHNAAWLWVSPEGRLIRAADIGSDELRVWLAELAKAPQ